MATENYQVGELVQFVSGKWTGITSVVPWPIISEEPSYVLMQSDGKVEGILASFDDFEPIDRSAQGFSQLVYQLIRLLSYLNEKAIM